MNAESGDGTAEWVRLGDLATTVRSKNAGNFHHTMDAIFDDRAAYERVRDSGAVTAERVAALYGVPAGRVTGVLFFDPGLAVKITMRRDVASGDPGDADVYGCQQFVPLLDLRVPAAARAGGAGEGDRAGGPS